MRLGTELGKQAKEFMDAGQLVPDDLTIELTRQRIAAPDCRAGFIVDGFPRTGEQAEAFDRMLAGQNLQLDAAVYFKITEDEATERLLKRAGLEGRADDNEATIRTRFEVYEKQTRPLIAHYAKMGKLVEIDASRTIDEIFAELKKIRRSPLFFDAEYIDQVGRRDRADEAGGPDNGRGAGGVVRLVRAGITTAELDRAAEEKIRAQGAEPAFIGYRGYRHATCISVNQEVVHGIPGSKTLKDGDIVSLDVGVEEGWLSAATRPRPARSGRCRPRRPS